MKQDTLTDAVPAQASFVFPKAPAVQEGETIPAPAHPAQPQASPDFPQATAEPKTSQSVLKIPIILAIVTGLIGLGQPVVTSLLSSRHEDDKAQNEAKRALRKELLDKGNSLILSLRATRNILTNEGVAAAGPARTRYAKAVKGWYASRADLRDRAQMYFGSEFALLIDAPSGKNIIVDKCGVVVKRDDPRRATDCNARLAYEVDILGARQDAVNAEKPVPAEEPGVLIPGDFATSLKIANALLKRVSDCQRAQTGPAENQPQPTSLACPNLEPLRHDLNDRINLLGLRQDEIARRLPNE